MSNFQINKSNFFNDLTIGGWTCEIPSYYGKAITTPAPDLVALNGGELLDSWWSGDGGILGINSYVSHNAKFDIPKEYL
jgi:hypothetical protein